MTENEKLLISFEEILESKLQAHLVPIKKDVAELKEDVSNLKADVANLKKDVSTLKGDVAGLDIRQSRTEYKLDVLTREVIQVKEDVAALNGRAACLEKAYERLDRKMDSVIAISNEQQESIKRIEVVYLENKLIPRVNHIEACYMSVFERYKENNDRLPELYDNVANISRTVEKHSELLKKIS